MTMNPPISLPSPALPAPRFPYSKVDANRLAKKSVSRFKRMADSTNQKFAAELLLQMRRIATDELSSPSSTITSPPPSAAVHLISPMQRPKATKFVSRGIADIRLPNSPMIPYTPRMETSIHLRQDSPTRMQEEVSMNRFRAVSIGGVNDLEVPAVGGNVSPLHLDASVADVPREDPVYLSILAEKKPVLMPTTGASAIKHPEDRWNTNNASSNLVSAKSSFESDNEDEDEMTQKSEEKGSLTVPKRITTSMPTKKYVGDSLAPGVEMRDILRKKFSWKSFPELEAYLISHRVPYLACSNAMNYTKAQKQYNNELTQGLLDLAAKEGYVFEGFSFAMVRDRIRCFYKSFVQATKKKKRPGVKTATNGAPLAKRVRADTV